MAAKIIGAAAVHFHREATRRLRPIYEEALRTLDEVGALEPLRQMVQWALWLPREDKRELLPDLGPLVVDWSWGPNSPGHRKGVGVSFTSPILRSTAPSLEVFLHQEPLHVEITLGGHAVFFLNEALGRRPYEEAPDALLEAIEETIEALEEAARKFLAWSKKVARYWDKTEGQPSVRFKKLNAMIRPT